MNKLITWNQSRFACLVLSATVLHVLACTSRPPLSETRGGGLNESQSLRSHAEQLWAARQAGDCRAQYRLEDPSQSKQVDEASFVSWCENENPFRVSEFAVQQVQVQEDWGWIHVTAKTVFTGVPGAQAEGTETWEKWHRIEGRWYPVPKREGKTVPEAPALRNAAEEVRVRARFEESWSALQAKEFHHLYKMVDPRDREDNTEENFVTTMGKIQYLSYKVHWVEVIADRGKVHVTYEHKLTDPSLSKLPVRELAVTDHWIARDGEWYRDVKLEQSLPCGSGACDSK